MDNLFNIDSLYRNKPKEPFTEGKNQGFEILLVYFWLHEMDGEDANFYKKVKNSIKKNNLLVQSIKTNGKFDISKELSFKILYVDDTEPNNSNNASIVIQLNYGTQKYLFIGDAENTDAKYFRFVKTLKDIVQNFHEQAEYMKIRYE